MQKILISQTWCVKILVNKLYPLFLMGCVRDWHIQKKDKYSGKRQGHHCCLMDSIFSIPCRASYFAQDDFEE